METTKPAKPAPEEEVRTPPQWAKHFGLDPSTASGVRATGPWELHDSITEAEYQEAMTRFAEGGSHGHC